MAAVDPPVLPPARSPRGAVDFPDYHCGHPLVVTGDGVGGYDLLLVVATHDLTADGHHRFGHLAEGVAEHLAVINGHHEHNLVDILADLVQMYIDDLVIGALPWW